MPTHQLFVLGERDVTLQDTRTHARSRFVRLPGVFRETHGGTPVANREVAVLEGALCAFLQFALESAIVHVVNEEQGARPALHAMGTAACVLFLTVPGVIVARFVGEWLRYRDLDAEQREQVRHALVHVRRRLGPTQLLYGCAQRRQDPAAAGRADHRNA